MGEGMRVVVAGCGGISGAWLGNLPQLPEVEIVGLVDLREDAARRRRDEFGLAGARTGTDLGQMLAALRPDAVWDCTVPEAHAEVTLAALAHGCHVMGEKPMADSMAKARQMVTAAEAAGKIYAVVQNRRYQNQIRSVRRFIEEGRLGRVTTLNCDFYIGAHFGGFRDRMRHVLLLDMAIHTFDAARLLSGSDPLSVYCHEWNPAGSWYDHDASAVAVFEMTGGLVYTYRGSWCAEGRNTSWECDWRIVGERGTLSWDGGDGIGAETVVGTGGFRSETEEAAVLVEDFGPKSGGHQGLLRDFTHCVLHGGRPETVCTDNIKSLAMVFGAIESATGGRKVDISI